MRFFNIISTTYNFFKIDLFYINLSILNFIFKISFKISKNYKTQLEKITTVVTCTNCQRLGLFYKTYIRNVSIINLYPQKNIIKLKNKPPIRSMTDLAAAAMTSFS
jgi:hypothetical protein